MGWFSSCCSFVSSTVSSVASGIGSAVSSVASGIGSAVSSVASGISSVASSVWDSAKEMASKTVDWLADKAENFVDGVKKAWDTVKPYISQIRGVIKIAAAAVPIPWVKGALLFLDKGLSVFDTLEESPILKKISDAIGWAIALAKRWTGQSQKEEERERDRMDKEELEMARRHQESLRFAEREAYADEGLQHSIGLAAAINDYEIAKTDLANTIDGSPADFEHYLRLRATQKLLAMSDKKFRSAETVDDLSADDLFMVRIASDLIKPNPELSNEAALRLDRLLMQRFGRRLTPFVFEELIASWGKRADALGADWNVLNKAYSKEKMLLNRLNLAAEIQDELSEEESIELARLKVDVPKKKEELDHTALRQRDIERYVGAAEGFLQLLEKEPEQIEAEDRAYLLEDGAEVGRLLIDCAENNKSFHDLSADDQILITDYSNIFKKESKERMSSILEVTA